jgi:hypothetical protein
MVTMPMLAALAAIAPAPSMPALIETVDLTTPVISPDGTTVAFRQGRASLNSNRYELSWWTLPVDGSGGPIKVGDGGTALWKSEGVPVIEPPQWSLDSRNIYYRALRSGQVQVWRARGDGTGDQVVSRDDADVDSFALQGENRLTYSVRATRSQIIEMERTLYEKGVRIDGTVDPSQNLFDAVEINGRPAVERFSGRWFQRDSLAFATPERFKTVDLGTLALVDESDKGGPSRAKALDVFAKVKIWASARSERFGEARLTYAAGRWRLEVVRPDGSVVTCAGAPCDLPSLDWVAWRPEQDEVVFRAQDDQHRTVLASWRIGRPPRTILVAPGRFDGGESGVPCAIGPGAVICVQAAAMTPPTLEEIDLVSGARHVLAAPNGTSIVDPALVAKSLVWKDKEGRVFTGELIAPAGAAQVPLFINYYNCSGYLRGGTGDEWPFVAFAKAGIAALCIQRRPGSMDVMANYDEALSGVSAAIDLLDREGRIDRRRVGMGGLSFGTEVTVWVARKSNLLAAASIASVLIEPAYYWLNGVAGRDVHDGLREAWKLGAPEETPERWKQVSPALSIEEFKTPLLMQLPEQEFRPTIEFFARLSTSKTPVELHVFPQERHVLAQPRHRLAAYERNLDWFRFWLQDYVDPDPLKVDQYRRWRAMPRPTPRS